MPRFGSSQGEKLQEGTCLLDRCQVSEAELPISSLEVVFNTALISSLYGIKADVGKSEE